MLRVATWNVRALRDGRGRVVAALRDLAPDLLVVQEAPRLVLWRTSRELLARAGGLRVLTRSWSGGNLLLAAPHVQRLAAGGALMPKHEGLHRRAVVTARVRVHGVELLLAGTHLDLQPEARLDSARRVRAALGDGPVVLGADVNEQPGGPAWAALTDGLTAVSPGPTFPAGAPRRQIDVLATSLVVRSAQVVDTGAASDHRAVLAELALPG